MLSVQAGVIHIYMNIYIYIMFNLKSHKSWQLTKVSAGCSTSSITAQFPAERNFKGQSSFWAAYVMEILIFTAVNVRSHITPPVPMVTDHNSSPPPQVSLPVRAIGNVRGKPWVGHVLFRDRRRCMSAFWIDKSILVCHAAVFNNCSCQAC